MIFNENLKIFATHQTFSKTVLRRKLFIFTCLFYEKDALAYVNRSNSIKVDRQTLISSSFPRSLSLFRLDFRQCSEADSFFEILPRALAPVPENLASSSCSNSGEKTTELEPELGTGANRVFRCWGDSLFTTFNLEIIFELTMITNKINIWIFHDRNYSR